MPVKFIDSEDITLKCCPFCGDSVRMTYSNFGGEKIFFVYHNAKNCILEGLSISDKYINTFQEACAPWNRRDGRS